MPLIESGAPPAPMRARIRECFNCSCTIIVGALTGEDPFPGAVVVGDARKFDTAVDAADAHAAVIKLGQTDVHAAVDACDFDAAGGLRHFDATIDARHLDAAFNLAHYDRAIDALRTHF